MQQSKETKGLIEYDKDIPVMSSSKQIDNTDLPANICLTSYKSWSTGSKKTLQRVQIIALINLVYYIYPFIVLKKNT